HERNRLRGDSMCGDDARPFEDRRRARTHHDEPTAPSERVHTHFAQIALRWTSSPRRHAIASLELMTASRLPAVCTLPSDGWKKHGRTVPSVSITDDTHGALHSFGAKSPSPARAEK